MKKTLNIDDISVLKNMGKEDSSKITCLTLKGVMLDEGTQLVFNSVTSLTILDQTVDIKNVFSNFPKIRLLVLANCTIEDQLVDILPPLLELRIINSKIDELPSFIFSLDKLTTLVFCKIDGRIDVNNSFSTLENLSSLSLEDLEINNFDFSLDQYFQPEIGEYHELFLQNCQVQKFPKNVPHENDNISFFFGGCTFENYTEDDMHELKEKFPLSYY
jgi:hypothetical protein